jgi:hypothetical protein
MRTPSKFVLLALLVALGVVVTPSPAAASSGGPVFGYWSEFLDHWGGYFKKQSGVVMIALGVGAVSLFIITRGKWKK